MLTVIMRKSIFVSTVLHRKSKDFYILMESVHIYMYCMGMCYYRVSKKKFLLGFNLDLKENFKISSSMLRDFFLYMSGIVLTTKPFLVDI